MIIVVTIKCFQKNVYINKINMLYYNVSERIDVKKTRASKECIIGHNYLKSLSFNRVSAMSDMMY